MIWSLDLLYIDHLREICYTLTMDYILRYPLTSDDVKFLNATTVEFELHNSRLLSENDSGWCDMATDARIITDNDRVIFRNVTDKQYTFLKLKYPVRLKELTSGLREIYNVAEQHNASPEAVIDSAEVI